MSFTNTKRHVELVIEKINNEIAISIIKLKKLLPSKETKGS